MFLFVTLILQLIFLVSWQFIFFHLCTAVNDFNRSAVNFDDPCNDVVYPCNLVAVMNLVFLTLIFMSNSWPILSYYKHLTSRKSLCRPHQARIRFHGNFAAVDVLNYLVERIYFVCIR